MKRIVTHLFLPICALLCAGLGKSGAQFPEKVGEPLSGILETLIVERGTVTIDLDLNRAGGTGRAGKMDTYRFQAAPDSFFRILVFNKDLRAPKAGSIPLIPTRSGVPPGPLGTSFNQLTLEKLPFGEPFEMAIRDAKTGFVFFNLEGNEYRYEAETRSFQVHGGRLLISEAFANKLGRPTEAGFVAGKISIAAIMRAIEIRKVVDGVDESAILPPVSGTRGQSGQAVVPGPDVIVGDLYALQQFGGSSGTQVGLAVGTVSCNAGNQELNWFALPSNDHPVIPQNLYRMSSNADRIEQIGQSWLKHAYMALQESDCSACTSSGTGTQLGVGCSDPYDASLNGTQSALGSRAWVNPFTGAFPAGPSPAPYTVRNHSGHSHLAPSHRILVEIGDLRPDLNVGATYYAEAQYVTPHEYTWCQAHPGECNMYNNASYRRFTVTGTTSFTFTPQENTERLKPAIEAWTGSTVTPIEPAPGIDGRALVAYKVTGPNNGMWHYEYAINNQNLDRAIQSFSVPLGCGIAVSNIGFHAPPNHPGFANDGTVGSAGYSNAAWTSSPTADALTWNTETFAQNQNANAIRWGTLYNFRFDSDRPPQAANATVGFFKNGQPTTVAIQAPSSPCTPLQVTGAVSRKTHGTAGTFNIDLPLTGPPGVECRRASGNGEHTVVVTFSNNIVSGSAQLTEGTGQVSGDPIFAGNTMTVNLTGVPKAERIAVTLAGVTDSFSQVHAETTVPMKAIWGDTGANSAVTSSDITDVKSRSGSDASAANFRSDVTADGSINSSDITVVKSMSGAMVP